MRYGFYQLHRDLFEDDEIRYLRDRAVPLFQTFEVDNKMSMIKPFEARAEQPRSFGLLEDVLRWFWSSPFPGLFRSLYEHEPALMIDFLTVRHHAVGSTFSHVAWHADVNFAGAAGPMMVCWVPLDPVGETAPGLEFCQPRHKATQAALHSGWYKVLSRGKNRSLQDEDLASLYGVDNYRTEGHVLDIGDCYVFDRYTVHRTQRMTQATAARYAIEFRVTSRTLSPRHEIEDGHLVLSVYDRANSRIDIMTAPQLYRGKAAGRP